MLVRSWRLAPLFGILLHCFMPFVHSGVRAQTPDLPPAALPFSNVVVSTQTAPNAIVVAGDARATVGIVMGAAEVEMNAFGQLCFATDAPSIGVTSGLGTDEFIITGAELLFAGVDIKCCPELSLATLFGITDEAIGTLIGGVYSEFPLSAPPLWAAGVSACDGCDIVTFGLCVVTEDDNLEFVLGGVQYTVPFPGPLVAPPQTWTNGQAAGVLLFTATEARKIVGGNTTTYPYPGAFIGYTVQANSVTVQTTGGDVVVPLALNVNVQAFGAVQDAVIDFNLYNCPYVGAINLGWEPGGLQCPPVVMIPPAGPLRGRGQPQQQVGFEEEEDPDAGGNEKIAKALQDTTWVADWTFDSAGACATSGWTSEEIIAGDPSCSDTSVDPSCLGPLGLWARQYMGVTDNDLCTLNSTCAWLFTDHTTPTVFTDPGAAFGPGGYVIKNWLDNVIVSPWVSLASTSGADGTIVTTRSFPGNDFAHSRIVDNLAVRSKLGTPPDPESIGEWRSTETWHSLGSYRWQTREFDLTPYIEPGAQAIQVRYRVADWQEIGGSAPPALLNTGPGPYLDRVRIGRRVLAGPVVTPGMDTRRQAQDAFPTLADFSPSTSRFGHCAFSAAGDLAVNGSAAGIEIEDAISVAVTDARNAGGISDVTLYGAIVAGPHAGKAPPPYVVGGNGFFTVSAALGVDRMRGTEVGRRYFVDLDDEYFRGGDVMHYVWCAADHGGGSTSYPAGLAGIPLSVAAAQQATGGLLEVSYLPAIDWDPAYLARIAADPHGKLDPTAEEVAASSQKNCILYVQKVNSARRAGDEHRTAFMYALDRLGYRGSYDVYDQQAVGNTNNDLASRATLQQLTGYNLIVCETGPRRSGNLPDGTDPETEELDQATFYRDFLSQAVTSQAGFATLWMMGTNLLEEKRTNALFTTRMGVSLAHENQGLGLNPSVDGQTSFTFDQGAGQAVVDFATDAFVLNGGCPDRQDYDGLAVAGTGVRTHRYANGTTLGDGAIVMNRNNAENWNTILQSHPWSEIRDDVGTPENPAPELALLAKVLGGVLPAACLKSPGPTSVPGDDRVAVPARTFLYQNVPNPFNPATVIRFDLATEAAVELRIYDVAGRAVRELVQATLQPGRHALPWDGRDAMGNPVAAGIYFYRVKSADYTATRKMVILK